MLLRYFLWFGSEFIFRPLRVCSPWGKDRYTKMEDTCFLHIFDTQTTDAEKNDYKEGIAMSYKALVVGYVH